jgi:HK97 family phage prohead protease
VYYLIIKKNMKYYKIHNSTFSRMKVKNYRELWEKTIEQGYDGLAFDCFTKVQKKGENNFHFTFSTPTEDRHLDIVEQKFQLTNYKKNPVLLDSHSYESITDIIGKVNKIGIKDGSLKGQVEFSLDTPKGMIAYKLAEGGFLNATSIGFIPKKFDDKDPNKILESELLEISAVAVPANPEALMSKLKEVVEEGTFQGVISPNDDEKEEKDVNPQDDIEEPENDELDALEEELEDDEMEVMFEAEEGLLKELNEAGGDDEDEIGESEEEVEEKSVLLEIAKELSKTTPENLAQRKRIIFKQLRDALSQDNTQ